MEKSKGPQANTWRGIFLSLLISIMIAESTSAVGLKLLGRPIYWNSDKTWQPPIVLPLRSEKDPWGAWGIPNTTSRQVSECYSVEYKFNGVGARDRERQIESPKRWIVLGDSGPEGYGIEQNERFTDILEKSLGWEFANFASSGDLGPLQYLLVYKDLAKKFEHYGVIVGFTFFNDFTDNDAEWWKLNRNLANQYRYRPYSVLSADDKSYRIIYGVNGDATPRADYNVPPSVPHTHLVQGLYDPRTPSADESQKSTIRIIARGLSKVSATFSLLRQLSSEWTDRNLQPRNWGAFTDNQREIAAAKLALNDLSQEIGSRPKAILLLYLHPDLVERRKRGANFSEEVSRFLEDLRSDGWKIIDTADILSELDQSHDITLGCRDDHWNAMTNHRVAEFLIEHDRGYLTGETHQVGQ